jgi:cbb3-type cytochrome oxidase subunit 3
MFEWLSQMENTKPLALVIFFVAYLGIIVYLVSNKKRSKRLESYKNIPFQEDQQETSEKDVKQVKGQDNG